MDVPSYYSLLTLVPIGIVTYVVLGAIYRLYFHPLSKFPGPKLAAITHLYEFYFNIIKDGMFIWEIERMHQKYGPIVRITPHELHIKDPHFYDEIYASSARKREKYIGFVAHFGAPLSMVTTINHDHHRLRRGVLNKYFSKQSVVRLEPIIQEKVRKLAKRFEDASKTGTVVRLDAAYTALTMDIITHYSYGASYNYLDEDDFKISWKNAVLDASANGALLRHFPSVFTISKRIPPWLLKKLDPQAAVLLEIQQMVRKQSIESLENRASKKEPSQNTVFDALNDPSLPPEERTLDRLQDEGQILLGAGSETTAKTLTTITFHLLNNRSLLRKLKEELKQVMPTPSSTASWTELEKLPYLSAVINEGLRLSYGVTTRLPRVAPNEALKYNDWVIPPGTPVSESAYFVHMDPSIFPNPESFDPERWIRAAEKGERLDRFIVSFTKGSRQCLGINLAYAELYLTLAGIVRRFDMDLYETTVDDVRLVRDRFFGAAKDGSLGVRAVITGFDEE